VSRAAIIDALLDHQLRLRADLDEERVKVDVLRDALSECLAALPDTDPWRDYQELYVLTDPEMSDYTVNG